MRKPMARHIARQAVEIEAARGQAYDLTGPQAAVQKTVTVVAEGDSWFSYFPAHDVLATLRQRVWDGIEYKVFDRAKAGALLNDMVYGRDLVDTYELIDKHRPDVFLFSGGGNDIAGPELFVMLYHKKAVELRAGTPYINGKIIEGLVQEVFLQTYQDLIGLVRWKAAQIGKPRLPIVLHGYDYAIPDGRGWAGGFGPLPGPWLDPQLAKKGYDRKLDKVIRGKIVNALIDAFNVMLKKVAATDPNVFHVNLRNTLAPREWANELHPTRQGFLKVTEAIEQRMRKVV